MDYLKTYNYFYNKTLCVAKCLIIKKFKESKNKRRPFLPMANKILIEINSKQLRKYQEKIMANAKGSFIEFSNRYNYYAGSNSEILSSVLEDEVFASFNKTSTYSYNFFLADLAVHESLKEIGRHFQNYYDYYQLIYEYDRYDFFYLKDFEGIDFRSSEEYKSLRNLKYPETENLNEFYEQDSKKSNKEEKKKKNKNLAPNAANTMEMVESFEDDERYLLLHVFNKLINDDIMSEDIRQFRIDRVSLMKLIKIIGGFEDNSIFYQNPNQSTSYKKVTKGVSYYSGKTPLKRIDSTIDKLKDLDLEIIIEELKRMKTQQITKQRKRY